MNVEVALERRNDPAAARELQRILFGLPRDFADEPAEGDQPEPTTDDSPASSS